jgi:uncharacterized OB-fold protein
MSCHQLFFPPLDLGCPGCGATELEDAALEARGVLYSQATVHAHRDDTETPFTVGEVVLDGGPLIRALLTSDCLALDERVEAIWVQVAVVDEGIVTVEPRFGARP